MLTDVVLYSSGILSRVQAKLKEAVGPGLMVEEMSAADMKKRLESPEFRAKMLEALGPRKAVDELDRLGLTGGNSD